MNPADSLVKIDNALSAWKSADAHLAALARLALQTAGTVGDAEAERELAEQLPISRGKREHSYRALLAAIKAHQDRVAI